MFMAAKKKKLGTGATLTVQGYNLLRKYRGYGLKYVFSAGIILLDRLKPEERERMILQVVEQDEKEIAAEIAATDEEGSASPPPGVPHSRPGSPRKPH